MRLGGKTWKSRTSDFWLVEVPLLDLATQAEKKEEIPAMLKDAIESLVDDTSFLVNISMSDNTVFVESNDPKKLMALILKRQRASQQLTLQEVAENLNAKSVNEYAQYEQAKSLASIEKFEEMLHAINPDLKPFLSCS